MSNLKLLRVQPLFFTPLIVFELEDAARLNSDLLAEALALRKKSPGLSRSNIKGWHSEDDFFERKEPACRELRDRILQAVQTATAQLAPDFNFAANMLEAQGWINVLDAGGMNTPHDHPNWTLSGTYYVQVPRYDAELSGCIEFLDSRTNVRTLTISSASCFMSKYALQPKAGMLILFPSYLRHWVYPGESSEPRVSVAFNVRYVTRSSQT